jgi:hypothetical protein
MMIGAEIRRRWRALADVDEPADGRRMSESEIAYERETRRAVALLAGLLVLAGPRRTRPLAGFMYGLTLSRVQGAGVHRANDGIRYTYGVLLQLFDEKTSVGDRVADLAARVHDLEIAFGFTLPENHQADVDGLVVAGAIARITSWRVDPGVA